MTFRGCADRSLSSNSRGVVVYFACLSGRSYLSSGETSVGDDVTSCGRDRWNCGPVLE